MSAAAERSVRDLAQPPGGRALIGIGCALLGLFLFSANNVTMKALVQRYPVSEMLFARSVVALIWIAPMIRLRDIIDIGRKSRPALHLFRMAMSAMEVMCFFYAVSRLQLADVTTFYLATPIYVTALSVLTLGEKVGWRRWAAVIVGFGGVLVALHPSRDAISWPALIACLGGLLYSFVVVTTRGLRATPNHMLVALQLVAILATVLTMADSSWRLPNGRDVLLMLGVGTISVASYLAFNHALRIAPASVVAPFQYTSIIWAILFGYAVFGDIPTPTVLLGAAIICAAGLFILLRERVRARPA